MQRQLVAIVMSGAMLVVGGSTWQPAAAQSPVAPNPPVEARPSESQPGAGNDTGRRGPQRFQRRPEPAPPAAAPDNRAPSSEAEAEPPGCRFQPNRLELIV